MGSSAVVYKFGGSSLANQKAIQHVIDNIISTNKTLLSSAIVCVSAPGKRHEEDIKVTDALIELHKLGVEKNREQFDKMFDKSIHSRYIEISNESNLIEAIETTAAKVYDNAISNKNSNSIDFALSRGEYLNAIAICALLNSNGHAYEFIDAAEMIQFDDSCTLNYSETIQSIKSTIASSSKKEVIIPGFYGRNKNTNLINASEKIVTFSRGGSDVTGALVAAALSDEYNMVYENWTDVDGIYNADPKICKNATVWNTLTYDHVHALSLAGANVFHPDAIYPVQINNVKTNIRNTNKPWKENGTWIVNDLLKRNNINCKDQIAIGVSSIVDKNELCVVSSNVKNNNVVRNIMVETLEHLNMKHTVINNETIPHPLIVNMKLEEKHDIDNAVQAVFSKLFL
jgi:aspartate kinase